VGGYPESINLSLASYSLTLATATDEQ